MLAEIMSRRPKRQARQGKCHPVTEEELNELRSTIISLRQTYDRVLVEGRSDDQTCGAANYEFGQLQHEVFERRKERDRLLFELNRAKCELNDLHEQCEKEKEAGDACREEAAQLEKQMEEAKSEILKLRGETEMISYFQDTVETETIYRLRADCQNLEIEREMDEIKVRHLKIERDELVSQLDKLKEESKALNNDSEGKSREMIEAEMEYDMQYVRQQALIEHLERSGWKPPKDMTSLTKHENLGDKMKSSVMGLFRGFARQDSCRSGPSTHQVNVIEESESEEEQQKRPPQVGGIFMANDTEENKDFFRQLPRVFRIGVPDQSANCDQYAPKFEFSEEINLNEETSSTVSELSGQSE
mmetsp:Transcript_7858/g.16819  ORF Transcript_7858/g.16819 Transcript_7858/m.16819 type:complete len:359 (+) Transcript_7858:112-1188(+)